MNRRVASLAMLIAIGCVVAAMPALADGRVLEPSVSDPVQTWRIAELKFPLLNSKSAVVQVAYIRASGTLDHSIEHTFSGADYDSFLGALSTSAGASEAGCLVEGVPDRACILNLRLSNWMVTHGKIEGVTAEALSPSTVEE